MAVWTVYLSLCLLIALRASVEAKPVERKACSVCRAGWSFYECRCFKFFNIAYKWIDAEKFCFHVYGNLASVHSDGEHTFIKKLVIGSGQSGFSWLGGHDAVQEGEWLWSDGTQMNYKLWGSGQPDNYAGKQHCLAMYSHINWYDEECSNKKPFVCVY